MSWLWNPAPHFRLTPRWNRRLIDKSFFIDYNTANNPRQACYPEMVSARKKEAQIGGVFFYGAQSAFHQATSEAICAR